MLSSDGKRTYNVGLDPPYCDCDDIRYRKRTCKHIKRRAAEVRAAHG